MEKWSRLDAEVAREIHLAAVTRRSERETINIANDFLIECHEGVYVPTDKSSTLFLLRHIEARIVAPVSVLDVGTGSGALLAWTARNNPEATLVGVDIDPAAVTTAAANLARLGMKAQVVESNLFEQLDPHEFDLVLFNAPLCGCETNPLAVAGSRALCDPGGATLRAFLDQVPKWLSMSGVAYVTVSNAVSTLASIPSELEGSLVGFEVFASGFLRAVIALTMPQATC